MVDQLKCTDRVTLNGTRPLIYSKGVAAPDYIYIYTYLISYFTWILIPYEVFHRVSKVSGNDENSKNAATPKALNDFSMEVCHIKA